MRSLKALTRLRICAVTSELSLIAYISCANSFSQFTLFTYLWPAVPYKPFSDKVCSGIFPAFIFLPDFSQFLYSLLLAFREWGGVVWGSYLEVRFGLNMIQFLHEVKYLRMCMIKKMSKLSMETFTAVVCSPGTNIFVSPHCWQKLSRLVYVIVNNIVRKCHGLFILRHFRYEVISEALFNFFWCQEGQAKEPFQPHGYFWVRFFVLWRQTQSLYLSPPSLREMKLATPDSRVRSKF